MTKLYQWRDQRKHWHIIPDGSCVICKHCSDIFLDPLRGNEIYMCQCDISGEVGKPKLCKDFVYDETAEVME